MGKKSRRDRAGNGIMAPRTMPECKHPHYNSKFRSIELTDCLRALDVVQVMLTLQKEGHLVKWQLGRKGTHIASHFITAGGLADTLTSPGPEDENYEMLTRAHVERAVGILRMGEAKARRTFYDELFLRCDLASGQVK